MKRVYTIVKKHLLLGICVTLFGVLPLRSVALSSSANVPTWLDPSQVTLKNVVPAHIPAFYHAAHAENLNCEDVASTDGTGAKCFIETAFGRMDVESNSAMFLGSSDHAIPVTSYINGQILLAWPRADTVLALTLLPTGGAQIGMYRFFTSSLADVTNLAGQVTGKRVTRNADLTLSGANGQPLIFNPNVLAYSNQGGWLVGETFNDGFVRINLATLRVVSFAPTLAGSGSPGSNESQVAITDDGRFAAIGSRAASSLRVYDLSACTTNCGSHDYWPLLAAQLPSNFGTFHLRFLNDGLLAFHSNTGALEADYLLAPTDHIDALLPYLGLGDSYSSGEGAGDYRAGTDTGANMCHLSEGSYPLLLLRDVYNGAHSVACSGAKSSDLVANNPSSYAGQAADGIRGDMRSSDALSNLLATFSPGYLPQADFVGQYQPAIVTAGIGGNDIGFLPIITECVMLHATRSNSCYNTYEDRLEFANLIDRTMPVLERTYQTIRAAAPLGNVYVIGYPEIVAAGNCALNVHLNADEIQLALSLIRHLNAAVAEAASRAGVTYIDVSQALAGHRLCETKSTAIAVNGLTAGRDKGFVLPAALGGGNVTFLSNGSYHPNAYGQQLLEQAIRDKLHTVTPVSAPYVPAVNDTAGLLNAPKTDRPTSTVSFVSMTSANVSPGTSLGIQFDGLSVGLRPNASYTVHLDGSTSTPVGTVQTDGSGNVSGSVTIPANTGDQVAHTIDVVGTNLNGEPADVRQVITVADPPISNAASDPAAGVTLSSTSIAAVTRVSETPNTPSGSSTVSTLRSGKVLGATAPKRQSGLLQTQQSPLLKQHASVTRPRLRRIDIIPYVGILLLWWIAYVFVRIISGWRHVVQ